MKHINQLSISPHNTPSLEPQQTKHASNTNVLLKRRGKKCRYKANVFIPHSDTYRQSFLLALPCCFQPPPPPRMYLEHITDRHPGPAPPRMYLEHITDRHPGPPPPPPRMYLEHITDRHPGIQQLLASLVADAAHDRGWLPNQTKLLSPVVVHRDGRRVPLWLGHHKASRHKLRVHISGGRGGCAHIKMEG